MKRKEEILVTTGDRVKIAQEVGCHINSVAPALSGVRNSALADKIREVAIKKFGGVKRK